MTSGTSGQSRLCLNATRVAVTFDRLGAMTPSIERVSCFHQPRLRTPQMPNYMCACLANVTCIHFIWLFTIDLMSPGHFLDLPSKLLQSDFRQSQECISSLCLVEQVFNAA